MSPSSGGLYGLMAEFTRPEELLSAAGRAREAGYRRMDAYTPFPVEGIDEALGLGPTRVPLLVLAGGLAGCVGGYLLQTWAMVWSYPINVGGRPLNSWPAFIPVTFETTILCASLAAVFGMLALNGLPMPYHPVFNVPRFSEASGHGFFLCIETRDPLFLIEETRGHLRAWGAKEVHDVAP